MIIYGASIEMTIPINEDKSEIKLFIPVIFSIITNIAKIIINHINILLIHFILLLELFEINFSIRHYKATDLL